MERADETNLTYTICRSDRAPVPGEYLVTIGKRGVGRVSLIRAVRRVNHKTVTDEQAYRLTVRHDPELKALTVYELGDGTADVWVRGLPAWPCFWTPRRNPAEAKS